MVYLFKMVIFYGYERKANITGFPGAENITCEHHPCEVSTGLDPEESGRSTGASSASNHGNFWSFCMVILKSQSEIIYKKMVF